MLFLLTEAPLLLSADESLVLGRDLEIQLEVRPVSDSGLLLHAGTSPDQHLTLVLRQGEVRTIRDAGFYLVIKVKKAELLLWRSLQQNLTMIVCMCVFVCVQVIVSVNSGKGEFSTSFTPEEPLCNGHWHTITGEFRSTNTSSEPVTVLLPRPVVVMLLCLLCVSSGEEEQRPAAPCGRGQ